MKRNPAYDPPGYVDWAPDPQPASENFQERIQANSTRKQVLGDQR